MAIKEHRIDSFDQYMNIVQKHLDGTYVFRGDSRVDRRLVPSIGRTRYYNDYSKFDEKEIFELFKARARRYVTINLLDDWDWLAFAQHHLMPTRLLDWSESPLVAAFF